MTIKLVAQTEDKDQTDILFKYKDQETGQEVLTMQRLEKSEIRNLIETLDNAIHH